MRLADVKLTWKLSVSADVVRQVAVVSIDGSEATAFEVSKEVDAVMIEVKASSSVVFQVESFDNEGLSSISELYTFTVGDLVAPQPATDLFHEVIAIRDVVVEPVE